MDFSGLLPWDLIQYMHCIFFYSVEINILKSRQLAFLFKVFFQNSFNSFLTQYFVHANKYVGH
jgi:hypothetical protein